MTVVGMYVFPNHFVVDLVVDFVEFTKVCG